jgi:hypothetical protein
MSDDFANRYPNINHFVIGVAGLKLARMNTARHSSERSTLARWCGRESSSTTRWMMPWLTWSAG